jgi:hypothetical protein
MKALWFLVYIILFPVFAASQATTGSLAGKIKAENEIILNGAFIKIIHEPTGTSYFSTAGKTGNYAVHNLSPGNNYTIEVSFINYETQRKKDIVINLCEETTIDFVLKQQVAVLKEVSVAATYANKNSGTIINRDKMDLLPGRNMYEQLRSIPQAKLVEGNEGAVSFAGQNNRFNSLYVDGAVNNDVFGLSASGTNGGQAAVSILPADAIAQFQVAMTPYDASLGNFTGAAINATTRSGTNRKENAVYHFFSNRNLSGKTPTGDKKDAAKLNSFFSRIYGFRTQGAFIVNKLFYFVNIELQRELFSQPFLFDGYKGNTKDVRLATILSNAIKANYHYDPGSFLDNPESVNADRIVMRFDWNINRRNNLSFSSRYTYAQRMNTNASTENTIHFSNDGSALFSGTNSFSVELKTRIGKNAANKLLLTYTQVKDDREPLLKAFPRVRINDGEGAFVFGTDNSSTINLLTQSNWTVSDKYKFTLGKHAPTIGFDVEYNKILNAFIQNSFGNYTYYSLSDFLTNNRPSAYQINFSLTDGQHSDRTDAAAKFSVFKTAFFVNDEIRYQRLVVNYGIRMDAIFFPTIPMQNEYVNEIAIPQFEKYWDIENARSGGKIKVPVSVSPRVGFIFRVPEHAIALRGGAGIFSGRLPLAWPGGVYNNNGKFIGGFSANTAQLNRIRFRQDAYHQWLPEELGTVANKEPINLLAEKFSMPKLWRISLAMDKKWKGWNATAEIMYSKNISEIKYTNLNLSPPVVKLTGVDGRSVYSNINNAKIPLEADGSNPFDYAILLGNNKTNTGYAYDCSAGIIGSLGHDWKLDLNYHYGQSYVNNEGTSSVNLTQWRTMETVNGRNFITRSVSDFSAGHRIFAMFNRTFQNRPAKTAVTLSFIYTGQSGTPVSYVYEGSMTRDDGIFGAYDLIYVPTKGELDEMIFLSNTINGITYTAVQQKESLNRLIENDGYLKKRRGNYAERNGSRTPFTHVIDFRIRYDIRMVVSHKKYQVQFSFDLFNLTNFLNRDWGRRYFQPNDNIALLNFAGYTGSPDQFIPQYRFDPGTVLKEKWAVSSSPTPAYSARWNGKLGLRVVF